MIGETLGSYRVLSPIGKGGMGEVFLAEHTLIGRKVAIKVLLPQFSVDVELVSRFFNEARAAAKIQHPGLIEVFDFGHHDEGSAYGLAGTPSRGIMTHAFGGLVESCSSPLLMYCLEQ